jgi:hypothetical protein
MRDKYKIGIILVCLIPIILLLIPGIAYSGVTYTPLDPITTGLKFPEDVAVSDSGNIFVVDGSKNQVLIYDRKGQSAGIISIKNPTSIAVNGNGNIYIGTNFDLSVKILDSSYNVIGSLGIGANEFKLPKNITIDKSTGNLYVVDQLAHSIKIYSSNGTYISKINDYPNLPEDLTIVNNEIYVIDHPLITDSYGGTIRGARVRVFDMSGNPTRSFGSYGTQEGQLIRPTGITSDADGKLYVTDSFHGVALCYNSSGSYLGAIQDQSIPMVTPTGIALSMEKKLFIASLQTANVRVFGLEGFTNMDISPSALSFTAQDGQPNPASQNLTINNSGQGVITFTASSSESWMVLNLKSGSVGPGASITLPVGVNISGLSPTTYNGTVTIAGNSGIDGIKVKLEVAPSPKPVISAEPQTLSYSYNIGGPQPSSQQLTITISNGTATWTATPSADWIKVSPTSASSNSSMAATVSIDTSNLTPGDYTGKITIEADAVGSPIEITINLTVKYSGTINVTCNYPVASFTIQGTANYQGSGQTWTTTNASQGSYTITYDPVVGYIAPQSEIKELNINTTTISFVGTYKSLAMSADIVVSDGGDRKNPSIIGIFDSKGTKLASFIPFSWQRYSSSFNTAYGFNTAIGDIDGDGKKDILVGIKSASKNPALVAAYKADGTLIKGSDFLALNTKSYGANVALADFDGDGKAEIIVGADASPRNPAEVRIFSYDSGKIIDTGIDFNAFDFKGGVNIAAGDVDGDGIPELITGAGANYYASPEVKVWKIITSGASWSVVDTGIHFVAFTGKFGANVATGDINGDGINEIIVSSGPDPQGGHNIIKVFNGNGTEFGLTITDDSIGNGLNVASADLDSDGVAEIVVGLGPYTRNPSTVKIYKADGTLFNSFNAFNNSRYGALISVGDLY